MWTNTAFLAQNRSPRVGENQDGRIMHAQLRPELPELKTIVVKVGSKILSDAEEAMPTARIRRLADDLARLRDNGTQMIVVSSGAIAHGMRALGLSRRPHEIPMQQACASIGQIRLMHMYESLFSGRSITIGQVLLTWDDLHVKKRYLNLRNTLFQLLSCNAMPIVNENDSVGVEEIRFGDNDTLAAQISMLVNADLFVNLTDINGLYTGNPKTDPSAEHIPYVESITPSVFALARKEGTDVGVGGMVTKLRAAAMVTKAGIRAIIGDGYNAGLTAVLDDGSAGTLFSPSDKRMPARRRWIAFTGKSKGTLTVDAGAHKALTKFGKSLLPAGIRTVSGTFAVGDTVDITDAKGRVFARGLVNYRAADIEKIKGAQTERIEAILGGMPFEEVIHRNNLALV